MDIKNQIQSYLSKNYKGLYLDEVSSLTLTKDTLVELITEVCKNVQEEQIKICAERAKVSMYSHEVGKDDILLTDPSNKLFVAHSDDPEKKEVDFFAKVVPESILNCPRVELK